MCAWCLYSDSDGFEVKKWCYQGLQIERQLPFLLTVMIALCSPSTQAQSPTRWIAYNREEIEQNIVRLATKKNLKAFRTKVIKTQPDKREVAATRKAMLVHSK